MTPTLLRMIALDVLGVFCVVAAATTVFALLVDRMRVRLTEDVQASRRSTEAELRSIRAVLDRVENALGRVRDEMSSVRLELGSIRRSVAELSAAPTEPRFVLLIPATLELSTSEPESDALDTAPASPTPETAAEVDSTSPAPAEADFDFTALTSAHDPTLEAPPAPAFEHGDHLPE